jgi:DNA adenine methylase
MKPLFMWAGGKKKLLKDYAPHLPEEFANYCEPFFGGGAMFTWAYNKQPNAHFYINDINEHIIGIYRAVRDDVELFCDYMDKYQETYMPLPAPGEPGGETNKELEKKYKHPEVRGRKDWKAIYSEQPSRRHLYFKVRDIYAWQHESMDPIFEAATLYFLMKTGFNGVWQINNNTNGRFGTPCGLLKHDRDKGHTVYDKENVMEWHKALQNCTITSGDFKDTLSHIDDNTFVFLDPPYRGGFADYGTKKDDDFQKEVVQFLNDAKSKGACCMLSNRDMADNFFEDLKQDNAIEYFDVTYTVGRRKKKLDEEGNQVKDEEGNPVFQEAVKAREILMIGLDKQKSSVIIQK